MEKLSESNLEKALSSRGWTLLTSHQWYGNEWIRCHNVWNGKTHLEYYGGLDKLIHLLSTDLACKLLEKEV